MSVRIDIHADDFGESVHASRDILECLKDGKLNSISVLANMSCFEECVRLYREAQEEFPWQPAISVHVNLMEGSCLSDPKDLPDLVDEKGHFQISWEKLFFVSYLPSRNRFKKQLKKEIELQIKAVAGVFSELNLQELRIDSHQHTHMIPVVAEALFEGSLNHFENRSALKEKIEALGGKVTGCVTGKTICLINNDSTSNSAKNKKARELGIAVLTEEEFMKQYLEK